MTVLEAVLRRERAVVATGLAVLTLLAWTYVWQGAGMGGSALDMTSFALFPHARTGAMAGMDMSGSAAPSALAWVTVLGMWWIMMIAMMTPSAAPLVLLYARVLHHNESQGRDVTAYAPSAFLAAGYLSAWFAFSAAAAALQFASQRAGLVSTMMLSSKSAVLSGVVLVATGLYQLSPLKHACLRHCRGPVQFLTQHWRPGRRGAFVMGLEHGAWCVGCCWMLMALLFVGGIMNLVWIALLTLLVLAEKVAPRGAAVSRATGILLVAWGVVTFAV